MHTIDIIKKRRSVRKFKSKQVPWDNVVNIVNCAINAPAAGNVCNVKFIVVKDAGNRKSIADACYNQAWVATAPVIIAIVAEPEHQKRYYGSRGERLYTTQHAAACAMSMIIAAESLGLATCWVGAFDEDKMRDALGMPEQANVHVILPIGFADENPKSPVKPWIRTVTYLEKWWAARKVPAYGYYSDNVMKMTKKAGDGLKKVGKETGDAIKKLKDKVIGKK